MNIGCSGKWLNWLIKGNSGRAVIEVTGITVSMIAGFFGGWWLSGGLFYGIVWAVCLPLIVAAGVFGISYIVNHRP